MQNNIIVTPNRLNILFSTPGSSMADIECHKYLNAIAKL